MSTDPLPPIPAKRYFTIGEVAQLCALKPYVLRYWEQEFSQLRPVKRAGNRRYYQHHEVLMIRRIRELLYDQGFTIQGARLRLHEKYEQDDLLSLPIEANESAPALSPEPFVFMPDQDTDEWNYQKVRQELLKLRDSLS